MFIAAVNDIIKDAKITSSLCASSAGAVMTSAETHINRITIVDCEACDVICAMIHHILD